MLIPKELVSEVLKWLPVKSLMRFKSVSRIWLSIITDLSFAKAYCGGSRGLLSGEPSHLHLCFNRCFFYIGLDGGSGITKQILPHHIVEHGGLDQSKGYTDIVDGLLCFYRGKDSWLYNVATREMVQLPASTDDGATHPEEDCRYNFGFDLVNKRYKLLKTCPGHVEILTIGIDSSWRTVNSLPPQQIESVSACLGGFLCWKDLYGRQLWAFHLVEEKFITIPTPAKLGEYEFFGRRILELINFGPSIVVTKPGEDEDEDVFRADILRYCLPDDGKGTEGMWVDELPEFDWLDVGDGCPLDAYCPTILGILPSGKMLMYDQSEPFPASIYFLDPANKYYWEMIEIDADWDLLHEYDWEYAGDIFNDCCYFEENIISLTHLTSCI